MTTENKQLGADVKSAAEQMQDVITNLASQRDDAIVQLQDSSLSVVDAVRLCKYVAFAQAQITDLVERQSLAKLLAK